MRYLEFEGVSLNRQKNLENMTPSNSKKFNPSENVHLSLRGGGQKT